MDSVENLPELVRKAQKGDKEAFGKIYDLLLDRVYRFIYFRVGSKEDAEDLAELTFMKVWDNLKGYRDFGLPFEAWVFRIARNQVIDFYRTNKRNAAIEEGFEVEDDTPGPEEIADINLTKERVSEAIKKLPDSYREIITLKFVEELQNDEISQILDKPVDQIRVLQSRALKVLRKVLDEKV